MNGAELRNVLDKHIADRIVVYLQDGRSFDLPDNRWLVEVGPTDPTMTIHDPDGSTRYIEIWSIIEVVCSGSANTPTNGRYESRD